MDQIADAVVRIESRAGSEIFSHSKFMHYCLSISCCEVGFDICITKPTGDGSFVTSDASASDRIGMPQS